ncbi:MAG: hypothetical protein WC456_03795 [Patescibacteria group bacterium]
MKKIILFCLALAIPLAAQLEKENLGKKDTVIVIGELVGVDFPVFFNWEITDNIKYHHADGQSIASREKIAYRAGGEYHNSIFAYSLIALAIYWILRRLDNKRKTHAVIILLINSLVTISVSMLMVYGLNWLFAPKTYDIVAVGFSSVFVGIFAAIGIIIAIALSDDDSIDLTGCLLIFLLSLTLNIGAGKTVGMGYGLFSQQAEALWAFLGLYLGAGSLALAVRMIIISFRKFNEPIVIEMGNDPDITKIVG